MGLLKVIITAALLTSVYCRKVMGAPVVEQEHCSVRFQEAFQEVLLLKKTCGGMKYKDCCQIAEVSKTFNHNLESKVHEISNPCEEDSPFSQDMPPMRARCNMESNDGGWIVLMRRTPELNEQTSFNREWKDYENGFGNLTGEFWYGLKNMHCLTAREQMEAEVEVSKINGTKRILSYGNFKIDGPSTSYTLHVSEKQHEGDDNFAFHNGMKFTTTDRDNDRHNENCAVRYNNGGWWFNRCYHMHLTDEIKPNLPHGTLYDYAELRVRSKTCTASLTTTRNCSE